MKSHYQWTEAYNYSLLGKYNKAEVLYSQVYQQLNKTPEFIYNYAAFLKKANKPNMALSIINNCSTVDYQTQILKGSLYADIKRYNSAFQHFKLAHEMCPNRFKPLYEMYIILGKVSDKKAQTRLGRIILNKSVKVASYEIDIIKGKIKQDLNAKDL